MDDKRDQVHAAITELYAEGGALYKAPPELTAYFDDAAIVRVAKDYIERQEDVSVGGMAVIISAGPPGAGKTEALGTLSLDGYRIIDPDVAKDMLLDEAERHGLLRYRNELVLPDGGVVGLRELATQVHTLSTKVTDIVRGIALAAEENVVIDGTLSWQPLAGVYINELFDAGYEGLDVLDVEAPLEVSLARAKERWWSGRQSDPHHGGRFISDAAIRGCYDEIHTHESKCAANAWELAERAADELGHGVLRRFDVDQTTGTLRQVRATSFS